MNIQTDLADKLPSLSSLCEEHSVEKMYAFGSVCSDEFTPQSDVDLLVTFKESLPVDAYADNYFSFKEKLENLLKRHVMRFGTLNARQGGTGGVYPAGSIQKLVGTDSTALTDHTKKRKAP